MNPKQRLQSWKVICALVSVLLLATSSWAWNLDAKRINALAFDKSGRISFTLFASGTSGGEFLCGAAGTPNAQWFFITSCGSANSECIAAVNRMANALLEAKISGRAVHVQRNGCEVTEVALKP